MCMFACVYYYPRCHARSVWLTHRVPICCAVGGPSLKIQVLCFVVFLSGSWRTRRQTFCARLGSSTNTRNSSRRSTVQSYEFIKESFFKQFTGQWPFNDESIRGKETHCIPTPLSPLLLTYLLQTKLTWKSYLAHRPTLAFLKISEENFWIFALKEADTITLRPTRPLRRVNCISYSLKDIDRLLDWLIFQRVINDGDIVCY